MMDSIISVIVPIYNIEGYLKKCVDSIIGQIYKDLEIILVDDGSTDSSSEICDSYKEQDSRVKVIHQKNKGLVGARKAGLSVASGNYIAFVDGDDWIDREMYSDMISVIDGFDFVETGYRETKAERNVVPGDYEINNESVNQIITLWMENYVPICKSTIWSKLYRAELIKKTYAQVPDDMSFGEDFVNYLNLLTVAKRFKVLGKIYYNYTMRDDSLCHCISKRYVLNVCNLYSYVRKFILGHFESVNQQTVDDWVFKTYYSTMIAWLNKSKIDLRLDPYKLQSPEVFFNKRIVIYGAGKVGTAFYKQLALYKSIDIAAWIDKNSQNCENEYCEISPIESILDKEFDYVLIAVLKEPLVNEIKESLIAAGVEREKIVWQNPLSTLKDEDEKIGNIHTVFKNKVAICIPAYNNALAVKKLLNSIQIQTFKDFFVVISDDSTNNDVAELVESYKNKFNLIFNKNQIPLGPTANTNAAIKIANDHQYEYLKIMHHDDFFTFDYSLQMFVNMLEQDKEAILAFSGTVQISSDKAYERAISDSELKALKADYRVLSIGNYIGAPSSVLVRKTAILPDVNLVWEVDLEWYMRLLDSNRHFCCTKEPLVSIFMGNDQMTFYCLENPELMLKEAIYTYKHNLFLHEEKYEQEFLRKISAYIEQREIIKFVAKQKQLYDCDEAFWQSLYDFARK